MSNEQGDKPEIFPGAVSKMTKETLTTSTRYGGMMPHFWAKTTNSGEPGISVFDHLINVGCAARCIVETCPQLLQRFQLTSDLTGALAALHDLGKISPGFQRKCEHWLTQNGLLELDRSSRWDASMEADHGKTSHAAIQDYLVQMGIPRKTAKFLAAALGAHHGRIKALPSDRGVVQGLKMITESKSGIDWQSARVNCAQDVWSYFGVQPGLPELTDKTSATWWLAGLAAVADWIGSDERFFPSEQQRRENSSLEQARHALSIIGLQPPRIASGLTFADLFGFAPNAMQKTVLTEITEPGLYIIEAPTGLGKTEAALGAAYKLLADGRARGIFFALPTQATSNRIHLRFTSYLERIAPDATQGRLVHGNSWLMDKEPLIQPATTSRDDAPSEDAQTGQDWFSSAKRALIAPFGVGTVDQALLGVVAARHFFVRHFALAGKVVILDEIHSYDLYTSTLIDKLIRILVDLGCTVIVLSATLTRKRRDWILRACAENDCAAQTEPDIDTAQEDPYPLVTCRTATGKPSQKSPAAPANREVMVDFQRLEDATEQARSLACKGGAVLWICNTVHAAQRQYAQFKELVHAAFPLGLLHSRFPFWRREQLENEWMERFGKSGRTRQGCILVSTQVVEQSVDLDSDFLVSELAPTDMLLQRTGRLWRHQRDNRPTDAPRLCILSEDRTLDALRSMNVRDIQDCLGVKARVYAPYILLRTLEVWSARASVIVPRDIRMLLEATYAEQDDEPDAWMSLCDEWFATDSAKKMLAARNTNLWQPPLDDTNEATQTRLNEIPTQALILCKNLDSDAVEFIDGTRLRFQRDPKAFQLPIAQAMHRNLVRVPQYCFSGTASGKQLGKYVHGSWSAGIVHDNGDVLVPELISPYRLHYSDDLGLVVKKTNG
jgi:CRISPR-associated endonuclease/helicase Cas3